MLCCLILGACSANSRDKKKKEALEKIEQIKLKPVPKIQPIEAFVDPKEFKYVANGKRDPFIVPKMLVEGTVSTPDHDRKKEELELFPLDSLRMVGTLHRNNMIWALILASDNKVHRVTTGNYLGQNFGKVAAISKDEMKVIETVPDGLGGWKKREVTMDLFQQGE